MKDIYDLLKELKRLGARIYSVEGKLKLDIKKEDLTKEIADTIKLFREDLLQLLSETRDFDFSEIKQVSSQDGYPISDAQRRLWVIYQIDKASPAYNMPGNFYLNSNVDINYFKLAVKAVVERHESLRTIFKENEEGEVKQWIRPTEDSGFTIDYFDYRNAVDKQEAVRAHLIKDSLMPFDLEKGPLFRAGLLQIDEEDYIFYSNMHHIISDGWSLKIYFSDLYAYYEAYKKKKRPDLKDLPIQYKDYSAWQIEQLNSGAFDAHRDFWFEHLGGELPKLDLPGAKMRPRIKTHNGRELNNSFISPIVTGKLKTYVEANGGSLFMGLVAVWNALMFRYTSQTDFVIGTPISGREHVDLKEQIGFYVNTLSIRNQVNPDDNFQSLFERVKQNMMDCYSHQMYPFNRLVEELDIERDVSRSPIFDVMLVFNNAASAKDGAESKQQELKGISDLEYNPAKFDLEVGFENIDEEYISIWGVYNIDIYEGEILDRLIKHYKQLLKGLLEEPDKKINEIDYLVKAEKRTILQTYNDTRLMLDGQENLVEMVEKQVDRTPDEIAVVFEDKELTYGELDHLSNQLAHYLKEKYAILPEDLVGVKLERSEWVIIAVLAALKSGGAYVPLDTEYPEERLDFIKNDTAYKVCLDENEITDFIQNKANYSTERLANKPTQSQLAYIIYTSGSTGKPKGVMIEHGSIAAHVAYQKQYFNFDKNEHVLWFSNLTFDASVEQIFIALSTGARLFIPTKECLLDGNLFNAYAKEVELTHINATPNFLSTINPEEYSTLKRLASGGEACPKSFVEKWEDKFEIYNKYGPTETTVASVIYHHESENQITDTVPIGKPVGNSHVYVVSDEGLLVPPGVAGEIWIGGRKVARGYLNREELTAEKFIESPFVNGERVYKTGDLGMWLSDGNLVFVGRNDDQVKVRGYRIEPGEVEYALSKIQGIKSTVVLAKENAEQNAELVAYITADEEQNMMDLRKDLKKYLPEYMIPAYFVQLENIPLTHNGKIDRKALPDPEGLGVVSGVQYVAPGNETEESIVAIWKKILQHEEIGILDDFFNLGGHSLKAVRLGNEYQKAFKVKLSINELFVNSRLEQHAELIRAASKSEVLEIPVVDEAVVRWEETNGIIKKGYPISDAQRRLWILSQFENSSVVYNMPNTIPLQGQYNIEHFIKAIEASIERHEILRTVFKEDKEGEVRQWVLDPSDLDLKIPVYDYRGKEEEVSTFIKDDAYKPFDLVNGPLIRAALFRVSDEAHVFYYNMHHIISDGWSMQVLAKDVFDNYEAYQQGVTEPKSEPLKIQYKDYSFWQLQQLDQDMFNQQRAFWLDNLSGELPVINLPSFKNRPIVKTNNGKSLGTHLTPELTTRLKKHITENGGSLFMELLAIWNVLVYRYTGEKDVITGTPVAGREFANLEDQIGFYINTLALRNKVDPEKSYNSFYKTLKENTINSYGNQMYPFDRLVEELDLKRDTARSAVFDIMLSVQNITDIKESPDLISIDFDEITDGGGSTSKFDISLTFQETGDCIAMHMVYNPDVYDEKLIKQLMRHYKQLAAQLMLKPNQTIASTNYLHSTELDQITHQFNLPVGNAITETSVLDLFSAQVENRAEKVALVFEGKELNYRELNERSNQLAHYLIKEYHVAKEDRVGILQDRSEWLIVSILAVLKCGASYVPMHIDYPEERVDVIKEDTAFKLCITEKEVEVFKEVQSNYSINNLVAKPEQDDWVYIIYTSGSSGKPKGVPVENGALLNYLQQQTDYFGVNNEDRFVLFSNPSFDASVEQMLLPLINGGSLYIPTADIIGDTDRFMAYCHTHQITHLHAVPLYLGQLNFEGEVPFKRVVSAGDKFDLKLWKELNGKTMLFNKYGPTESTISATIYQLPHELEGGRSVPIGKPIKNTQLFILDDTKNQQPVGVTGEIVIGGLGVANGYLNRKELTAEKFFTDPNLGSGTFYKTGDLGRWLPDGNVEFIGRLDEQVKVNGYRIEPAEIESVLNTCSDIIQGVVIPVTPDKSGVELAAWFTAESQVNIGEIKRHLKTTLPAYMLPSYFVQIEAFPFNTNGKVDREALIKLKNLKEIRANEYHAPQNETEEKLVRIWEEVLERENIGVKDDFFELGGQSLKAIKVITKINREFKTTLKIGNVFNASTIEDLSYAIDFAKNQQKMEENLGNLKEIEL